MSSSPCDRCDHEVADDDQEAFQSVNQLLCKYCYGSEYPKACPTCGREHQLKDQVDQCFKSHRTVLDDIVDAIN